MPGGHSVSGRTETVNAPDIAVRRIAVLLGPGGASRFLLDCLRPLLLADRDVELQGMFMREAAVRHAAELPFVKELCRVTFAVREFDGEGFERALALRIRTARQALTVLAEHTGAEHSFRDVAGSAVELLQQVIAEADITAFEPVRPPISSALTKYGQHSGKRRVAVLLTEPGLGRSALRAAAMLCGGDMSCLYVLLLPGPEVKMDALRELLREMPGGKPALVRAIDGGDFNDLAVALRDTCASIVVVPASPEMTDRNGLQFFRGQVRCPVCMVRDW
jgi:hypothetical protein